MINFDDYVNENRTEYNKNWPYIPDHPYRILITGGSGSGKTNLLLNLIENQPDIDKIYLYEKNRYEAKYQYLINKRERVGINHFNDPKGEIPNKGELQQITINHSSDISTKDFQNIYKNVQLNRIRFLLMILHLHQVIL